MQSGGAAVALGALLVVAVAACTGGNGDRTPETPIVRDPANFPQVSTLLERGAELEYNVLYEVDFLDGRGEHREIRAGAIRRMDTMSDTHSPLIVTNTLVATGDSYIECTWGFEGGPVEVRCFTFTDEGVPSGILGDLVETFETFSFLLEPAHVETIGAQEAYCYERPGRGAMMPASLCLRDDGLVLRATSHGRFDARAISIERLPPERTLLELPVASRAPEVIEHVDFCALRLPDLPMLQALAVRENC